MMLKRAGASIAALAAVLAAGVVATGGGGVARAQPVCPSLYVVAIPGTWETNAHAAGDRGLLRSVTNGLPSSVRSDYVPYAATAYPWEASIYGASEAQAVTNARGMIGAMALACPAARFAIVGYSQGADAAGDLAAEIGAGTGVIPPNKVAAVGLISDPRRAPTDALVGPPVGGAGAIGPRVGGFGWISPNVRTFCSAGDLYCAAPKEDFPGRIAGYFIQNSDPASSDRQQAIPEATPIVDDLLRAGGLPTLEGQLSDPANAQRQRTFRQFLQSGAHQDYTRYAVDGEGTSATTWLRNWIASKA